MEQMEQMKQMENGANEANGANEDDETITPSQPKTETKAFNLLRETLTNMMRVRGKKRNKLVSIVKSIRIWVHRKRRKII